VIYKKQYAIFNIKKRLLKCVRQVAPEEIFQVQDGMAKVIGHLAAGH
jgi:hypothetical protein